jgi:hypothetical protein
VPVLRVQLQASVGCRWPNPVRKKRHLVPFSFAEILLRFAASRAVVGQSAYTALP